MRERVLLVVGSGAEPKSESRREATAAGPARLAYVSSSEDVKSALDFPDVGIIVVLLMGRDDVECVDQVLWAVSTSRHRMPVIVVGERYDESDAILYLQMGATEYLSLHDHADSLGLIVDRLLSLDGSHALARDLTTGQNRSLAASAARPLSPSGLSS